MGKNKKVQKENARKHYLNNKDKIKARSRKWTINRISLNKEIVKEHLKNHPCVDCGNSTLAVLEFDHIRDKDKCISDAVNRGWSETRLRTEISKCEIRCANCHRIKTYKERGITKYD